MRTVAAALTACLLAAPALAAEKATVEILKTERSGGGMIRLLVRATNPKDRVAVVYMRCVAYEGGKPVFADRNGVLDVPAKGEAVDTILLNYQGEPDRIECLPT